MIFTCDDVVVEPNLDLNLLLVYDSLMNGEVHNGYVFSILFDDTVDIPSVLVFHYLRDVSLTLNASTVASPTLNRELFVLIPL